MRFLLVLMVIFGWNSMASSDAAATEPDRPARVLLLSGQNNHDWQQTTPKIRSLLEATGRFRVDVDEMDNPGFVALLVRGTEWAATGSVTRLKH